MSGENKQSFAPIKRESVFIIGLVLLALLLIILCILSALLASRLKKPSPTVQQEAPAILVPTAMLPTAVPVTYHFIRLPVVMTEPRSEPVPVPEAVSVSEQIWRVTQIDTSGYILNGQYYDLATFVRLDGLVTAQGYCINQGWDVPAIGVEYLLSAEDIFVPLQESVSDPLQRFSRIR